MLAFPTSQVVVHPCRYRVDGEVGRFQFETFDVLDSRARIVFRGLDLLPERTGKQWYQTVGFKEFAFLHGVLDRSYRKTDAAINLQRRQLKGGTPLSTLRDAAESEGAAVFAAIERETQQAFIEHDFTGEGQPIDSPASSTPDAEPEKMPTQPIEAVQQAWSAISKEMSQRGFTPEQIALAQPRIEDSSAPDYESPEHTTNIFIDDVCIKKQKPHRRLVVPSTEQQPDEELKRVHTSVARIEHVGKGFTLVGPSLFTLLRFVLAFLLCNGLTGNRLRFYVDGQRTLQDTILTFFGWHPAVSLILDWFHLVKKFKELLSMAMRGRELRNAQAKALLRMLWYGLVDEAINHLRSIDSSQIKDQKQIELLIGYLERNRSWIPNYALRRRLDLGNSSNPAERTCNLLASQRQKKNGMSWSTGGSHALSALACVVLNDRTRKWLTEAKFTLTFNQAA